jgi:hypothetical protein
VVSHQRAQDLNGRRHSHLLLQRTALLWFKPQQ